MRRLFPFIFLAAGIALCSWCFTQVMAAKASTTWPKVDGEVIGSTIKERVRASGNQPSLRRMFYKPLITYRFDYEGTTYEANKVWFGEGGSFTKGPAKRVQEKYPVGKTVSVSVNTANPRQSVLEPGMNGNARILPVVGIVVIIFGLFSLARSTRPRK